MCKEVLQLCVRTACTYKRKPHNDVKSQLFQIHLHVHSIHLSLT